MLLKNTIYEEASLIRLEPYVAWEAGWDRPGIRAVLRHSRARYENQGL